MLKEINGRWTCTDCGYEWSATAGDNEIPESCNCKETVLTINPLFLAYFEMMEKREANKNG
jgi:rubredoxin